MSTTYIIESPESGVLQRTENVARMVAEFGMTAALESSSVFPQKIEP